MNSDDWWSKPPLRAAAILEWHRREARREPNAWAEFVFRDAEGQALRQAALHRQLQQFLTDHPRALIELPRDHGKTLQVMIRVLWELGHRPWLRIKVVCATDALAIERGRFLRDSIAGNPRVRFVFPELVPGTPWTPERFTVCRPAEVIGPSVTTLGIDSAATGTRADLLVCDDIVDVRALVSRADRERVKTLFRDNLMNLLEPDGRIWCIFTPWHRDDLNAELKRNPAFALFRRAIGPDFEPIWPERWPRKRLIDRRQEIGESSFARAYRLCSISDDDVIIPRRVVQFWHEPLPPSQVTLLAIDPAISSKQTADASALVVLVQDEQHLIYCVEARAHRVRFPDLIDLIRDAHDRWHPDVIVLEANAAFRGLADLLKTRTPLGGKLLPVTQTTDKLTRVRLFSTSVFQGMFRLRGHEHGVHPAQETLYLQMTQFPHGDHDDLLDAAAMGTAWLLSSARAPIIR